VAGLGSDSFAEKERAIVGLGKLGDKRAIPVLQALGNDRVRTTADNRVVMITGGAGRIVDAATGDDVAGVAPDALDRVIVNNRFRGEMEAGLGGLTLFSAARATRRAAAEDALKHPSADTAVLLERALTAEAEAEVQASMRLALSASRLVA